MILEAQILFSEKWRNTYLMELMGTPEKKRMAR